MAVKERKTLTQIRGPILSLDYGQNKIGLVEDLFLLSDTQE
jgi:hypothetical protein